MPRTYVVFVANIVYLDFTNNTNQNIIMIVYKFVGLHIMAIQK